MSAPRTDDRKWLSLGILLVCTAIIGPFGWLLRRLIPAAATDAIAYYGAVLLQEAVLWLLPSLWLRPWRTRRLGPKEAVRPLLLLALPLGAAVQVGLAALQLLLPAAQSTTLLPQTAPEWGLAVLALAVAPAVCEECFFRGCVAVHLRDVLPAKTALLLSTLLFALMHGSLTGLPMHLAISFCCTLLMYATGRVTAPILVHLGFNLAALGLAYVDGTPWLGLVALLPAGLCVSVWRRLRPEGERTISAADRVLLALCLLCMAAGYVW